MFGTADDTGEDGWILVERGDGCTGFVPLQYLRKLDALSPSDLGPSDGSASHEIIGNDDDDRGTAAASPVGWAEGDGRPFAPAPGESTAAWKPPPPQKIPDEKKIFASVRQMEAVSALRSTPRVPSLEAAVQAEAYDEVMEKTEVSACPRSAPRCHASFGSHFVVACCSSPFLQSFFDSLKTTRAETFSKLKAMTAALVTRMDESIESTKFLDDKLAELAKKLEEEKTSHSQKQNFI